MASSPENAAAQTTDVHREIRAIRDADQADRQQDWSKLSPEEREKIAERDTERLNRVKTLLKDGKLETSEDFEHAALVFQHGTTVNDYLAAHELSFLQLLKSTRGAGNLVILSQDRFLQRIGQRQRFGTQRGYASDGSKRLIAQPVVEESPFAVSDALRADLYLPPLALYKQHSYLLPQGSFDTVIARLKQRYDARWLAESAQKPESKELAKLGTNRAVTHAERDRVLALYRADQLRTPDDFKNAAMVLLLAADSTQLNSEEEAQCYLLAHELAMVAAIRGKSAAAAKLVAVTMDRFLLRVGLPPRYNVDEKTEAVEPASASVRQAMGI